MKEPTPAAEVAAPAADLLTIESQTASQADTLTGTDTRRPLLLTF